MPVGRPRGLLWRYFYQLQQDEPAYALLHKPNGVHKGAWCRASVVLELIALATQDGLEAAPVVSVDMHEEEMDRHLFLRALQRVTPIRGEKMSFLNHIKDCAHCLDTCRKEVSSGGMADDARKSRKRKSKPSKLSTLPDGDEDRPNQRRKTPPPSGTDGWTSSTSTYGSDTSQVDLDLGGGSLRTGAIQESNDVVLPTRQPISAFPLESATIAQEGPESLSWLMGFSAGMAAAARMVSIKSGGPPSVSATTAANPIHDALLAAYPLPMSVTETLSSVPSSAATTSTSFATSQAFKDKTSNDYDQWNATDWLASVDSANIWTASAKAPSQKEADGPRLFETYSNNAPLDSLHHLSVVQSDALLSSIQWPSPPSDGIYHDMNVTRDHSNHQTSIISKDPYSDLLFSQAVVDTFQPMTETLALPPKSCNNFKNDRHDTSILNGTPWNQ